MNQLEIFKNDIETEIKKRLEKIREYCGNMRFSN